MQRPAFLSRLRPFGRWSPPSWFDGRAQDYVDAAIGVGLALVALGTITLTYHRLDPISGLMLLLQTLPVAVRRRNPIGVLCVTGVAIVVYSFLHYPEANGFWGVFVAFYTVAANEPRRRAVAAAVFMAVGTFLTFLAYTTLDVMSDWPVALAQVYLGYLLAWLIGDNLRVRRAYTKQLEQRTIELEREREERAVLAVSQERARIAQELHDVVAHHVSIMVVQASGARRVVDKDPAQARVALEAVEGAGRTALAEMRRMLEVLRTETAGVGPQPGLSELDRLIGQVREAGQPVDVEIEGEPRSLPAGMDLAAYRIIQEALTNVVKHAGKALARVSIRYEDESLELTISDDGRGAAARLLEGPEGGGRGLIGMRERVALYGGTLEAGPAYPLGYRVRATLPLEPPAKGSMSECCDEPSALAEVAGEVEALREREKRASLWTAEPEPMVAPPVVPPIIGRVIPPQAQPRVQVRPAATRRTRQTHSRTDAEPSTKRDAPTRKDVR